MKSYKINRGFSLIELLIVIAIIAILASIIIVSLRGPREKAQVAKVKSELQTLYNGLVSMEINTLRWPGPQSAGICGSQYTDNEICPYCEIKIYDDAAGIRGTNGNYPGWSGPYFQTEPRDSWGQEYFFDTDYDIDETAGVEYVAVLGSYGPDGMTGDGTDGVIEEWWYEDDWGSYSEDDIIYIICQ